MKGPPSDAADGKRALLHSRVVHVDPAETRGRHELPLLGPNCARPAVRAQDGEGAFSPSCPMPSALETERISRMAMSSLSKRQIASQQASSAKPMKGVGVQNDVRVEVVPQKMHSAELLRY